MFTFSISFPNSTHCTVTQGRMPCRLYELSSTWISRRVEGIGFLTRLQRQKVRISRKHILESAVKVCELYGSSSSVLEVEYFEEVGSDGSRANPWILFTGLARKDLILWRDSDISGPSIYANHPNGLYPVPISPGDIINGGRQYVNL